MARMRYIKPGIMTNEDLCELGPYAYILFTGLWMLADREGRLEDRPKRIKAEAMPLWEEVSWKDVENLLEGLTEKRFLHRYEADGVRYIQIVSWKKHQCPHPREGASVIPAASVSGSAPASSLVALPRHVQGSASARSSRVGNGEWVMGNGNGGVRKERGCGGEEPATAENAPAPPETPTPIPPPSAAKRKQPASERKDRGPQRKPLQRATTPLRERPINRGAPITDWWPHKPEDVNLVRDSLHELARQTGMPPPDDGIVRRVLDVAHGAGSEQIHAVLVALWRRNKFRSMYSWGYVPVVMGQWFRAA